MEKKCIFKTPSLQSYDLSTNENISVTEKDIRLFKNLKRNKKLVDIEKSNLESKERSKDFFKRVKKELGEEYLEELDNIYFMDLTKIFKKMKEINKEYNIGPGFTNAWRKMYEICEKFNFIPKKRIITHFDICGFPGGFVLAINHYLKTKRDDVDYEWFIQSYTGDFGFKDQFNLRKKNYYRFLEGPKKGDITNYKTILYYRKLFQKDKLDIITSDCGLSPEEVWESEDKNLTREKQMSKTFFSQFIAGISLLKKKGSFFMKHYTSTTTFTVSLVYLMCCLFKKVKLVKPESSRYPTANEIYFLLLDYKEEITDQFFDKLLDILKNWDSDIYQKNIISYTNMNKKVLENIENKLISFYEKRQKDKTEFRETIDRCVAPEEELFKNPEEYIIKSKKLEKEVDKETIEVAKNYIRRMKYERIDKMDRLV